MREFKEDLTGAYMEGTILATVSGLSVGGLGFDPGFGDWMRAWLAGLHRSLYVLMFDDCICIRYLHLRLTNLHPVHAAFAGVVLSCVRE